MADIIGIENINTSNANSLEGMFMGCKKLTSLDLRSFDFYYVQNVGRMFSGCSGLEEVILGIENFAMYNVTDVTNMFYNCSSLHTIYCNADLTYLSATEMFSQCSSLVGGNGTNFSSPASTYARPDGGSSEPGYFTSFTCPQVENITVVNVTGTSAEIFWDATSPYQNGWLLSVKPGGLIDTEDSHILLTGLQPKTRYTVGIQSMCGVIDDIIGKSVSFTTSYGEGVEEVQGDNVQSTKILRDGQLLILVGDKTYDARGVEI